MTQESMLARYKILHELGRGALGAVYAARDRETGAVLALKRFDPAVLGKPGASLAGPILKHARAARLLKHRNIVEVRDAGDVAGTVYVAMELLEGESLRAILERGPLPIARAIGIARDIASALAHAHLEGVVHGSLKPSNVIVLRSGVVKITDFGVGEASLPAAEGAGCPGYLSPEQARGGPVDHRCDLFSLGALLYEMLTHRPPFEGGSPKEVLQKILQGEPPPPSALNPLVPPALDEIVLRLLARQPGERMAGAPIVLRDLQQLEEGIGLGAFASAGTEPPAAEERPPPGPAAEREALDYHEAILAMERAAPLPPPRSARWPAVFSGLAIVLALFGLGLTGYLYYSSGLGERAIAALHMLVAPAPAPASAPEPVPTPTPKLGLARPVAPAPVAQPAPAPEESASAGAALEQEQVQPAPQPAARPAAHEAAEQRPGGTAKLILAVSPRGEIYIDGESHGTTPPITTFDLEPGMHRIEVRNGSRKPYLTYLTVQAGDVRRIRHDFNASRAVQPPPRASWQNSDRPVR